MKKLLTILAISAVLISSFSLLATAQDSDNEITLGDSNWPGLRGKNAIVNYILENIGYEVKRTSATDPMLRQGIINGDIDIYLGTWMPSLQEARTKNQDKQHLVTKNMHNGLLGMAVPKYVAEKGVTNLEDLQEHADKFDKKLYVGPAGCHDAKIREVEKKCLKIIVKLKIKKDKLILSVKDPGRGFEWEKCNLEAEVSFEEKGRGLKMINEVVDELEFNKSGNKITVCFFSKEKIAKK